MAAPNDFLAGVLSARASTGGRVFEPQKSNAATLRINMGGSFGTSDSLVLSLASFPLPKNETDISSIAYLNERRKFAGSTSYADMTVNFHDYVDRETLKTLWAWRLYIHDPRTGKRGLKSSYAKSATIDVYGPDGADSQVMTYIVEGIWPHALDVGDIDYSSDEPVRVTVPFCIDRAYPDPDSVIGAEIFSQVNKVQGR
jgi:hypothetical protein